MAAVNIDLNNIGKIATDIRSALTGKISPDKQAEIELKLLEMENQAMTAQIELNKVEAANPNIFISGWRPYIGWICGAAMSLYYFFFPIFRAISPDATLPEFDMGELMPLVMALLGLGGMRSWEKKNGVQGKH
jgi:hypothetical protein